MYDLTRLVFSAVSFPPVLVTYCTQNFSLVLIIYSFVQLLFHRTNHTFSTMKTILFLAGAAALVSSCKKDPSACFDFFPATELKTGDTVTFTNCSDNADSYLWEFADGTTSTEANPTHVFTATGSFSVTLTVTNDKSSEKISKVLDLSIVGLNNKVLFTNYWAGVRSEPYNFDLDNNGTTDVIMSQTSSFGSSGQRHYTKLEVSGDFSILYDTVVTIRDCSIDTFSDTVSVNVPPRISSSSNILPEVSLFTKEPIYLEYISGPGSSSSPCVPSRVVVDQLIDMNNDLYAVLKKENAEGLFIGWIQLRVVESGKIVLKAFKPMTKRENLIL